MPNCFTLTFTQNLLSCRKCLFLNDCQLRLDLTQRCSKLTSVTGRRVVNKLLNVLSEVGDELFDLRQGTLKTVMVK